MAHADRVSVVVETDWPDGRETLVPLQGDSPPEVWQRADKEVPVTGADILNKTPAAELKWSVGLRPRVVVGVDCSPESTRVLRRAAELAAQVGAALEAVFVYLSPADLTGVWPTVVPVDETPSYMDDLLQQTASTAFGGHDPKGLSLYAVEGDPAEVLTARSRNAAMLVVGSRGHGSLTNLLLGSVAAKCVEHASVPVLVVHSLDDDAMQSGAIEPHRNLRTAAARESAGRIVVGVDGSSASKLALQWAALLAKTMGVGIDAVITWDVPIHVGSFGPGYVPTHWAPHDEYADYLTSYVNDAFGDSRPADLRLLAEEGNAARRLLERAEGAALLVVGNRGRGGFASLLLGSVSANCANHAICPVLVVHAPQANGGQRGGDDLVARQAPSASVTHASVTHAGVTRR
jgi:nucleotide-binding universal stress UspA family protein